MTRVPVKTLKRFLRQEGSIGIVDDTGRTRMLQLTLPKYVSFAQAAARFWYNGAWHSREEFLRLCDKFQIDVGDGASN